MAILGLLNAINDLSDIHDQLLQLARDKQKLIIDNNVDQLMIVTSQENKAISRMQQLNEDINRRTGQCWTDLGLPPKPAYTLSDLIQAMPRVDWKISLTEAAERLRDQVRVLKIHNDRNQLLVRDSLAFANFQLDLFTAAPFEDVTYSPAKTAAAGVPRRSFDTKA